MKNITSVLSEKGGVGKTTTTYLLSQALSKDHKVLMIDMDGQKSNLTSVFSSALPGGYEDHTIYEVLTERNDIKESIYSVHENLNLIPATYSMSSLPRTKISVFKKAIQEVRDDYDYIFLDSSPSPTWSQVLQLSISDFLLLPLNPETSNLLAVSAVYESVEEIQMSMNPNLQIIGLVFNQYDGRTNMAKQVSSTVQKMAETMHTSVFGQTIRRSVTIPEAIFACQSLENYKPSAPVTKDVHAFVKEFQSRVEEANHGK